MASPSFPLSALCSLRLRSTRSPPCGTFYAMRPLAYPSGLSGEEKGEGEVGKEEKWRSAEDHEELEGDL